MIGFLLEAAGLGLAGLDPTGALIAVAALIAGARDRDIIVFGLVGLLGTVAFGSAVALALGPRIARIDWSKYAPDERTAAIIGVVLGLGLLVWGTVSLLRASVTRRNRSRGSSVCSALRARSRWPA